MKYFCKYLPVEGELKEGDKAKTPDGSIIKIELSRDGVSTGLITESPKQIQIGLRNVFVNHAELVKVKLFLCSRDIQIGDRARIMGHAFTSDLEIEQVVNGIIRFSTKEFIILDQLKENVFKVIGEISSGATWVKEGDEFNEDEMKRQYEVNSYSKPKLNSEFILIDESMDNEGKVYTYKKYKNIIKIKCPTCLIYH